MLFFINTLLLTALVSASSVLVILDQPETTFSHSLTHLLSQFDKVEIVQASNAPSLFTLWEVRQYDNIAILAPSLALTGSITAESLLAFLADGGNILFAVGSKGIFDCSSTIQSVKRCVILPLNSRLILTIG
jgi:hypothetical protein